jgi:hypothetical protein
LKTKSLSYIKREGNEKMVVVLGKQTIYLAGDSTMADYPPESYQEIPNV